MFFKFALSGSMQSYSVHKTLLQYLKSRTSCCSFLDYRYLMKTFSTASNPDDTTRQNTTVSEDADSSCKVKRKIKPRSSWVLVEEVRNYFLSKPSGKETVLEFPQIFFRKNRYLPENIYLADRNIAEIIASHMQKHMPAGECVVLEINPGIGLLSKCLINMNIQALHLYEPNTYFFNLLQDFKSQYNKVDVFSNDFLSFWKMIYQDRMDDGTRVNNILSRYSKKNWCEEPYLKIVVALQVSSFIQQLIMSLTTQQGIMTVCRPELFIMMPPSLFTYLTSTGADGYIRYRATSVLFQVFFDYELLEKLPRKAFVPWLKYPASKKKLRVGDSDEEYVYMVKIVPKKDLHKIFSPPEKFQQFWFFVRHHFRSRSNKLIPEMESWIPGCGIRLILEGYRLFTEVGELKPQEVLHIFQLFSSWPEFQDSSFLTSLETTVIKMEEVTGIEVKNSELSQLSSEFEEDTEASIQKDL